MEIVLTAIKDGRKIDAIKAFRNLYGAGLKESKDAVEAIERMLDRTAFIAEHEALHAAAITNAPADDGHFVVITRYNYDFDYGVVNHYNRTEAMADANRQTESNNLNDVIVAKVIALSETKRVMKEVA